MSEIWNSWTLAFVLLHPVVLRGVGDAGRAQAILDRATAAYGKARQP